MSPWFFGRKRLQRVLGGGVPPLLRLPEKVNERFAASAVDAHGRKDQSNGNVDIRTFKMSSE
jgi:hypothetical protein